MDTLIDWPAGPSDPSIEHGAVHVWAWDLTCSHKELLGYATLLSPEEQVRSRSFHFERGRLHYTNSRAVLRNLLGRYLSLEPISVCFTKNNFGRPELTPDLATSKLRFNLSHTNRMAMLAIGSDLEVGVDVEELCPIGAEFAEQYFSQRERADLEDLTHAEWVEGFYNCWTRKEAILKAEGIGLNANLDAFDVTLRPASPAVLLEFRASSGITHHWHLMRLSPGLGFVGALASGVVPRMLHCSHFVA